MRLVAFSVTVNKIFCLGFLFGFCIVLFCQHAIANRCFWVLYLLCSSAFWSLPKCFTTLSALRPCLNVFVHATSNIMQHHLLFPSLRKELEGQRDLQTSLVLHLKINLNFEFGLVFKSEFEMLFQFELKTRSSPLLHKLTWVIHH